MWSAGLQQCCLSMSFMKGKTLPESIGDRSAKCASCPHLTMTQLQFGYCDLQSCTCPLCLKLQYFLSSNQPPYRAAVTLNPIIDFFKCHFLQRGTVAFWKSRNVTTVFFHVFFCFACGTFVLLWYNNARFVHTCPDVALLFFFVLLLLLHPPLTSGYTRARPLALAQQPPQRALIRANHHSAASRAAFTGARVWTALISLTPM